MYPGSKENLELNHTKGYCSDGAPVRFGWQAKFRLTDKEKTAGPIWPQPLGIFVAGESFHPLVFLKTLWIMYDMMFVQARPRQELLLEYLGFATLLQQYTQTLAEGSILFKLPPHTDIVFPSGFSQESKETLVVQHDGTPHLRLDCLREDDPKTTSTPKQQQSHDDVGQQKSSNVL